jgi:hypothetical protein
MIRGQVPEFPYFKEKIFFAFLKIMNAKADESCILETTYFKEVFSLQNVSFWKPPRLFREKACLAC